jgi:hypothetical protein
MSIPILPRNVILHSLLSNLVFFLTMPRLGHRVLRTLQSSSKLQRKELLVLLLQQKMFRICGLCYKHNCHDDGKSDTTIWSITLLFVIDNTRLSRGINYDLVINYNRNHVYSTGHNMWHHLGASFTIVIMFIIQSTEPLSSSLF